ncbi:1-acyl-sn-glycerol-3-phosphate acyltransferase, partial [Baffinella frigidus]
LVCANHMSWFDVPSLHGFLGGRLLWSFAKAELVKVPVLGTYMKSAEHILISRTSRKSQLESLKTAISTLQGLKRNVFIFPEGTRSLDGATPLARCVNSVKIVPVTLMGNDVVFPANALMPICPGGNFMRLVVHPAIDPTGKTDDELMVLTREAIRSALPADKRD